MTFAFSHHLTHHMTDEESYGPHAAAALGYMTNPPVKINDPNMHKRRGDAHRRFHGCAQHANEQLPKARKTNPLQNHRVSINHFPHCTFQVFHLVLLGGGSYYFSFTISPSTQYLHNTLERVATIAATAADQMPATINQTDIYVASHITN